MALGLSNLRVNPKTIQENDIAVLANISVRNVENNIPSLATNIENSDKNVQRSFLLMHLLQVDIERR